MKNIKLSPIISCLFLMPLLMAISTRADCQVDFDATFFTPDMANASAYIKTLSQPNKEIKLDKDRIGPIYQTIYEDFASHGLVVASVISDGETNFKLWNGLVLINIETNRTYKVRAFNCVTSFCTYAGKIPVGEYFVDFVYSNSMFKTPAEVTYYHQEAPIRNALSRFTVSGNTITDLGLIGIYTLEKEANDSVFGIYLHDGPTQNIEIVESFYSKIMSIFTRIDNQPWLDKDIVRDIETKSKILYSAFFDFSKAKISYDNKILIPTALGRIIEINEGLAYKEYNLNTTYALHAIHKDKNGYIVGGEAGLVFSSDLNGQKWKKLNLFDSNESVVEIVPYNDNLFFVTLSNKVNIKVYVKSTLSSKVEYLDSTRAVFSDRAGAFVDNTRWWSSDRSDLDKQSLHVNCENRNNIRYLRFKIIKDALIMGFDRKGGLYFDFLSKKWLELRGLSVDWFDTIAVENRSIPSIEYIFFNKGKVVIEEKKGKKREGNGMNLMRSKNYFASFSKGKNGEIACHPSSNVIKIWDSKYAILCSVYSHSEENKLKLEQKRAAIHEIDINAGSVVREPIKQTDKLQFYLDTKLLYLHDTIYMIDGLRPIIYAISKDGSGWNILSFPRNINLDSEKIKNRSNPI